MENYDLELRMYYDKEDSTKLDTLSFRFFKEREDSSIVLAQFETKITTNKDFFDFLDILRIGNGNFELVYEKDMRTKIEIKDNIVEFSIEGTETISTFGVIANLSLIREFERVNVTLIKRNK